jgi:hypothetical protein
VNRRLRLIAALSVLVAGCSLLPIGRRPADVELPKPCAAVYSVARCQAMTDVVAADVVKNRADVTAVAIAPDPVPEGVTFGAGWHILVRISLRDGSTHDAKLCGGVPHEPACTDDPQLENSSVTGGGYDDHPCFGETPDTCASPLPTIEPAAAAAAMPLSIASRSIRIDHLGPYRVVLGEGSLPNGIVTDASFEFGEAWPDDLALRDGRARLELGSLEPDGKPFENYYLHGWRKGVENVQAILTLDVLWFAPGATLEIRNVVVR